jgi:hypothetical protein
VSAAPETLQATRHPFAAAMEARDHKALVDTLAPDVVLHSAVTRTTFDGRETVGEVYAAVIDSFEEIEVVDEFSSGTRTRPSGVVGSRAASSRVRTGCGWTAPARSARSPSWADRSRASLRSSQASERDSPAAGGAASSPRC